MAMKNQPTYAIMFKFVKQNHTIDNVKCLRKIKENTDGILFSSIDDTMMLNCQQYEEVLRLWNGYF
jgi:hypothetical protein